MPVKTLPSDCRRRW